MAITNAIGSASRRGILAHGSRVLETTSRLDVVVFDKTGTVSDGELSVRQADPGHLAILAAVESQSEHLIGRAIVKAARRAGLGSEPARDIHVHKGQGITSNVDSHDVFIRNRGMCRNVPVELEREALDLESSRATLVFCGSDGKTNGLNALGDRLREDMPALGSSLRRCRIGMMLVSGDSVRTTKWVAGAMGGKFELHCRAGAVPDGKAPIVGDLQKRGDVIAMIGDHITHAPALAQADLGMAM